jgi:N-acetylglucosamine-6-phosphate deacetylase
VNDIVITNVRALEPGTGVVATWLRISQGKIAEIGRGGCLAPASSPGTIDGAGRLLTPGMIDIHTHGIERFAYEAGPDQLIAGLRLPARYGTTCVLPTLYRALSRQHLGDLERLTAALADVKDVCVPGFHFEGPFLALPGAGAQTVPGDVGLLDELVAAAGGRVAAMSISPETPNILPVIERACQRGIVVFMTHTRATVEQTQAAIDAGARHATHFYDVFYPPAETDPGVRTVGSVEAILADPRCTVDFIADGVHVHPMAIKAAVAAKGAGVLLTTDSNIGAGLPPDIYDSPMGQIKTGAAARLHRPGTPSDGCLAGSTLTMDRGMSNLLAWLDLPEEQVWAMGTSNVSRLLRLVDKGSLRVGADADLVLWDRKDGRLTAVRTWVAGRQVFAEV